MTGIKTGINARTVNEVWAAFIKLARGEDVAFTDDHLREEMRTGKPILADYWIGAKRVIELIEQHRGLTPEQQYQKGIVSMLTRIQALFVSHEMRQMFGAEILSQLEHFDSTGEFQVSHKHDFMVPKRKAGKIVGMKFYTLGEMKAWPKTD